MQMRSGATGLLSYHKYAPSNDRRMIVDPKIIVSIEEAAREEGQSKALARRLVAWFGAIASGNEDINDKQASNRHLELLYNETELPVSNKGSDTDISPDDCNNLPESGELD